MASRWGDNENSDLVYFLGFQNHGRWWLQPWNKKILAPVKTSYDKPRQHIKKQSPSHKEGWVLKNWCFCTVVLEKTLKSPLDCKEIEPVNPKGKWKWNSLCHVWLCNPMNWNPWNSPGQHTGVGNLSVLQGIFPTQVSCIADGFFISWATRGAQEY